MTEHKISTFLWFDAQAEEAIRFYVATFKNTQMGDVTYYPKGGARPEGTVMTASCVIEGMEIVAMNAGPHFKFTEAVSLAVMCEDQAEVDHLWAALTKDGGKESDCGWLKDKYGFSWQITPRAMIEMNKSKDTAAVARSVAAMMTMKKLDIAKLKKAFEG